MIKLISTIIDFLFPKLCIICGLPGGSICKYCTFASLQPYYVQHCHVCRGESRIGLVHKDCRESTYLDGLIVGYVYNDVIERLVANIKYQFAFSGIVDLAELLWQQRGGDICKLGDCIFTFVPTSERRKRWRGFNQSELLCRELARLANQPYLELLQKPIHTDTQVHHGRNQRMQNLRDAFIIKPDMYEFLTQNSRSILVIDDITTTGSTLESVAKTLNGKVDSKVIGVVLARGS